MSTTKEREFKIYRNEEYAYKNTSCIKSFQLKKDKKLKDIFLAINGVIINPSKITQTDIIWDFKDIRNNIRDLFGETPKETELLSLESMISYNSLKAIQHYSLQKDELKSSVFTSNLIVQFVPNPPLDVIEVSETVFISDQQLLQSK